ncbi:MAG: hypothetical protein KC613_24355 [Myxococcales bacterium]|nr:hypothetical protein [Myxococcales bacterium]MCB9522811.1 hypothetical protein [Myxococcales bacterium]
MRSLTLPVTMPLVVGLLSLAAVHAQAEPAPAPADQAAAPADTRSLAQAAIARLNCPEPTARMKADLAADKAQLEANEASIADDIARLDTATQARLAEFAGPEPTARDNRYRVLREYLGKRNALEAERKAVAQRLAELPAALHSNACGEQLPGRTPRRGTLAFTGWTPPAPLALSAKEKAELDRVAGYFARRGAKAPQEAR